MVPMDRGKTLGGTKQNKTQLKLLLNSKGIITLFLNEGIDVHIF